MQLAALTYRISTLEAALARLELRGHGGVSRERRREAVDVATGLGLGAGVLWPDGTAANLDGRRRLAKALREKDWTCWEIAELMSCSERAVERGFSK